jgi:hypothetical protein
MRLSLHDILFGFMIFFSFVCYGIIPTSRPKSQSFERLARVELTPFLGHILQSNPSILGMLGINLHYFFSSFLSMRLSRSHVRSHRFGGLN